MRDLHDLYRGTHLTVMATSAVVEDVLRAKLIVAKSETDHQNTGKEVPYLFTKITREVVQHVIEFGYFAYRITDAGQGIRIGKPLETFPMLDAEGKLKVKTNPAYAFGPIVDDAEEEWQHAFFKDPTFIAGTNAAAGETRIIQSVLADARDLILRHNALLQTYMHRDADNSRHSGFATVNQQLGTDEELDMSVERYGAASSPSAEYSNQGFVAYTFLRETTEPLDSLPHGMGPPAYANSAVAEATAAAEAAATSCSGT